MHEEFRAFLDAWLRGTGWTAADLARETGIQPPVISRWLRSDAPARPTTDNLRLLAPILGVSEETLLRMAGHLSSKDPVADPDMPRAARDVLQRVGWLANLLRSVEGIDDPWLEPIIRAQIEKSEHDWRSFVQMIRQLRKNAPAAGTEDNHPPQGPVNSPPRVSTRHQRRVRPNVTPHELRLGANVCSV